MYQFLFDLLDMRKFCLGSLNGTRQKFGDLPAESSVMPVETLLHAVPRKVRFLLGMLVTLLVEAGIQNCFIYSFIGVETEAEGNTVSPHISGPMASLESIEACLVQNLVYIEFASQPPKFNCFLHPCLCTIGTIVSRVCWIL